VATGTYTSPHLRSFRERIEVGEETVSGERFAAAVEVAARLAGDEVTQFELLTAAAFAELAARDVDVAVIEAGLGGRYDATNVIPSRVCVLTSVALEHTRWLGPTTAHIAEEKLDVLQPDSTLVMGEVDSGVEAVAERVTAQRRARTVRVSAPAGGGYQRANLALAEAAAAAYLGRAPDPDAVNLAGAETSVPGRLEVVGHEPLVLHDAAHNPAGARALAAALPEPLGEHRPIVLVVSVLDDKDAPGMLSPLLPVADSVVLTRCAHPRAIDPDELAAAASRLGARDVETQADPRAAVERASELAGTAGAVVVTGSIYLIADLAREPGAARASTL